MMILDTYSKWCKETKRNGSVLVGSSIKEFFEWLEKEYSINITEKTGHPNFGGIKNFKNEPTTYAENLNNQIYMAKPFDSSDLTPELQGTLNTINKRFKHGGTL